MSKKREFGLNLTNTLLDACGIIFIFLAGYIPNQYWFSPLVIVLSIMTGYIMISGKITWTEEKKKIRMEIDPSLTFEEAHAKAVDKVKEQMKE